MVELRLELVVTDDGVVSLSPFYWQFNLLA
jgi:hypothetical protein